MIESPTPATDLALAPAIEAATQFRPSAKQAWQVLGFMVLAFLVMQFWFAVAIVALQAMGRLQLEDLLKNPGLGLLFAASVLNCVGLFTPPVAAAVLWRMRLREVFGLYAVRARVYVVVIAGTFALGVVLGSAMASAQERLGWDEGYLRMLGSSVASHGNPLRFAAAFFTVVVLAGTYEELVFRGFLQRALATKYSPAFSIVLCSALFGLIHGDLLQGAGASLLGLYLGFVVQRTRSVLPGIAAHWTQNTVFLIANQFPQETGVPEFDEHLPTWALGIMIALVIGSIIGVCGWCPAPRRPRPVVIELSPLSSEKAAGNAEESAGSNAS